MSKEVSLGAAGKGRAPGVTPLGCGHGRVRGIPECFRAERALRVAAAAPRHLDTSDLSAGSFAALCVGLRPPAHQVKQ